MTFKNNLYYLYFIVLILNFLPAFVLYLVPNTPVNIWFEFLFIIPLFAIVLLYKNNFAKFVYILKRTPIFRYYIIYISTISAVTLLNICLGLYNAPIGYYFIKMYRFILSCTLIYMLPLFGIFIKVNYRKIIKTFLFCSFCIFILSIIQFFIFTLKIQPLISVLDFFTNARYVLYKDFQCVQNIGRVYCTFGEPSGLGQFIFITMPIIMKLSSAKFKIFNNKYLNFLIKRTAVPFMLITVILTKSPIYLILCGIEYFILLIIFNIKLIKKYLIQVFLFIITFLSFFVYIYIAHKEAIESTYIFRILQTMYAIGDFNKLVFFEPSLATRIVSYSAQFGAFSKRIVFGCGINNVEVFLNSFYLQSTNLSFTPENIATYLNKPHWVGVNRSFFWTSLAETGILGIFSYLLFIYKNFSFLNQMKRLCYGIDKDFIHGLYWSMISIVIISFYNLGTDNNFMWLIFGFIPMLLYLQLRERDM